MIVDPVDQDVRDPDILLALHEHVRAALNPDIGQREEGNITTGYLDLLHFLFAGRGWVAAHIIADHHDNGRLRQRLDLLVSQIGEAASFKSIRGPLDQPCSSMER